MAGADQRLRGNDSPCARRSTSPTRGSTGSCRGRSSRPPSRWSSRRSRSGSGIVGQIVARLVGLAWNLVTFLVVPILVLEDLGVGDALKRSKDLFKKTWGENVIGQGGLGIVGFLAMIPGVLLIAIGAAMGTAGLVVLGAVGVAWIIASAVIVSALSGIYRTALYHYAAGGRVPGEFADLDLHDAFRPRRLGRGTGGAAGSGGLGGFFGGPSNN